MENSIIVKNLFDLYNYLAGYPQVSASDIGPFKIITSMGNEWPSMAYAPAIIFSRVELEHLKVSLESNSCKTLIVQDDITIEQQLLLKEQRFMPVAKWHNMSKQLAGEESMQSDVGLDVFVCNNVIQVNEWLSVASNVLFKGKPLPRDVFMNAVEEGKFILLIGKHDGMPVSTIMVYCGSEAGIYMVATEPAYQKKGYGRVMMSEAEKLIYKAGYREVCLHATQAGVPLYRSLGYSPHNSLILFYNFN